MTLYRKGCLMVINRTDCQSKHQSPLDRSILCRPWLWPIRFLNRLTTPIPAGLWLVNFFFQRILDINNSVLWMVNFTSRAVGNIRIGENVWICLTVSDGCYIQGGIGIKIDDLTQGAKEIEAGLEKRDYLNSCYSDLNALLLAFMAVLTQGKIAAYLKDDTPKRPWFQYHFLQRDERVLIDVIRESLGLSPLLLRKE